VSGATPAERVVQLAADRAVAPGPPWLRHRQFRL